MTKTAPVLQSEIERMMRAVRKVNGCESVAVELVNGAIRAFPAIPIVTTQDQRPIAKSRKNKPANLSEWRDAQRESKIGGHP